MTELLERAVEAARALPPSIQDEIACAMLLLAEDASEPVALTSAESDAIAISQAAAARGDFATDAEVRAMWARFGL